jgi:negative regulator of replication initiation
MDLIDQIITTSNLSQLDRYKCRYEELVNLSQSERDSVETSVKKEIQRIEQFVFTDEMKSTVKDCLKWKYITGFLLNNGHTLSYRTTAVSQFLSSTKEIFESSYSRLGEYKHHSEKDVTVSFKDPSIRDDFDKSIESLQSFADILLRYIYTNEKHVYLPFDYLMCDSYGVSRPSFGESFEDYLQRLKTTNSIFNLNRKYELEIQQRALQTEQNKTWFKSINKILKMEIQIQEFKEYSKLLEDFLDFIKKRYEKYVDSFTRLRKYEHDRKKVWYLKEVLEVLQALRENTKLKHFLLEKGFDLGLLG